MTAAERNGSAADAATADRDEPAPAPTTVISVCENGPLLVRGDFELQEIADGHRIDPRRRVIALCRCGNSRLKPFCDGSHAYPRRGGTSVDH